MIEYRTDFTEENLPSPREKMFLRFFGVLLIAAGTYIVIRDITIARSDSLLFSPILNIALGLAFIFRTLRPAMFRPRIFLNIDEQLITYKFGQFQKTTTIYWQTVKSVRFKPTRIEFILSDSSLVSMNLSYVSRSRANRIKPVISAIAGAKQIRID